MSEERVPCKARSKRSGTHCKRNAIPGGTVCYWHGGAAPQVAAAAAVRVIEAEAREAVGRLQLSTGPVDNPLLALQQVAGELLDVKNWIRGAVEELQASELRTRGEKGAEQVRAELTAYMGMLTACVNALAQLGKLRIDERLAAIDEERKRMIIEALRAGLASAGVIGAAQTAAMGVAARQLRVIAGGRAAA